jgi:ArsR family transcriptional regulator
MNITRNIRSTSTLLKAVSSAPRIRILLGIGAGEACVCHLEAALGWRQAYISQHLMALRNAGILISRRDGRFIYYRLQDPKILTLLETAADLAGVQLNAVSAPDNCPCPACSPAERLIPLESF